MKLRYFSDLHLEFIPSNKMEKFLKRIYPNIDEILILSGDIGNPYSQNYDIFMTFVSNNFKKVFIITGNHEYYNKDKNMEEINIYLTEYFTKFTNISFLNNSYEYYNNYCFIGTTLWSKITDLKYDINDVYNILDFNYEKYNDLHEKCVEFLNNCLEINNNCIIITHHVPSYSLINEKYKTAEMSPYNQWFCCDLDNLIQENKDKIKCWFYGHTHTPSNIILKEIPFLCNSIGYPNENNKTNFKISITL